VTSPSSLMSAPAEYYEALYLAYRRDPSSVDISWRIAFSLVDELIQGRGTSNSDDGLRNENQVQLAALLRDRGHLMASLDPLAAGPTSNIDDFYALQNCEKIVGVLTALPVPKEGLPPALLRLHDLYRGNLTVETAHIDDGRLRHRIRQSFEERPKTLDASGRRRALDLLIRAESFETLLGVRYSTKKRFGAEGAEAILPLLDRILRRAAEAGVREVVIGTMHRGRLNILANVLNKPLQQLFSEIIGTHPLTDTSLPADVPYHLGYSGRLDFGSASISVSLTPNPSHLEAVNSVAIGRTRARQDAAGCGSEALCILLHTDASVIGQGVVAETVQLSTVAGFHVAGTIHLIVNNQIGFTTDPDDARSSRHCTGVWKAVDSPILHVNGDALDEVLMAGELAVSFRTEHRKDVVVDLVCYRRNGHNEVDEPRFTQPVEYGRIDPHPTVREIYEKRLRAEGLVEEGYAQELGRRSREEFEKALDAAIESQASGIRNQSISIERRAEAPERATGVATDVLQKIASSLSTIPQSMVIGQKLARLVSQRTTCLSTGVPWALGEALAIGSLLIEGHAVRLSGQDVARGAFSHRHFVLTGVNNGIRHVSLNHLAEQQARFDVVNSPLSEYAVLGFEYGYSLERASSLTVWEAQFGDFANGAQIIFDQFIASAEEKWGQRSNLVMLLPHGLEGQGPEHSSARPERYLQLSAGRNFELAQPTTPANYFHLLRRQVHRRDAIPLVVLSPKTLLRLPAAVSALGAFGLDKRFLPLIVSPVRAASRVLLCSGKMAYLLEEECRRRESQDTAVVRLELLCPLPEDELMTVFRQWRGARYIWVQEEPDNYGAWSYLDRRLERLLQNAGASCSRVMCISRPARSSPAGSFHGDHEKHQREIVERAFSPHEQQDTANLRLRGMSADAQ
jgi:2-oxoglutarate dehydrogenase E1 component